MATLHVNDSRTCPSLSAWPVTRSSNRTSPWGCGAGEVLPPRDEKEVRQPDKDIHGARVDRSAA